MGLAKPFNGLVKPLTELAKAGLAYPGGGLRHLGGLSGVSGLANPGAAHKGSCAEACRTGLEMKRRGMGGEPKSRG